jgi:hypothetical protein
VRDGVYVFWHCLHPRSNKHATCALCQAKRVRGQPVAQRKVHRCVHAWHKCRQVQLWGSPANILACSSCRDSTLLNRGA